MFAIITIVILVAIDQLAKFCALQWLKPVGSVAVIDGILNFTFVENDGAAFGIMEGMRWLFVLGTIPVIIIIIMYYRSLPNYKPHTYMKIALIIVLSGAVGNFIDRLLRGYVVDFIQFKFFEFPVFNLADCYVTIGASIICFLMLFVVKDK